MNIEINNKTRSNINLVIVKKAIKFFLEQYNKKKYGVSVAFVGDRAIHKLNNKYRGIDKITDVLSFREEDAFIDLGYENCNFKNNFLGEIIINYAQIKRQSKKFGNTIKREMIFILTHGLLHLLGYDDNTEDGRKKMEALGEKFINKYNF